MKRIVSVIIISMMLLLLCACSGNEVSENMDNMAENGTVTDGDGFIGNEDKDNTDDPTLTMPTITMPSVTLNESESTNYRAEDSSTLLDNVI